MYSIPTSAKFSQEIRQLNYYVYLATKSQFWSRKHTRRLHEKDETVNAL